MANLRLTLENNVEDYLAVTQSFCRLMFQISLVAIPIYLGLFMIAVPFDMNAGVKRGLIIMTPVMEFLVAALVYAVGFLISPTDPDPENFEYSMRIKRRTARRKTKLIVLASVPFILGLASGSLLLVKAHL